MRIERVRSVTPRGQASDGTTAKAVRAVALEDHREEERSGERVRPISSSSDGRLPSCRLAHAPAPSRRRRFGAGNLCTEFGVGAQRGASRIGFSDGGVVHLCSQTARLLKLNSANIRFRRQHFATAGINRKVMVCGPTAGGDASGRSTARGAGLCTSRRRLNKSRKVMVHGDGHPSARTDTLMRELTP